MPAGALWYGPLLGKVWMKEMGLSEEELRSDFNPLRAYGLSFIGHLLIALTISYIISLSGGFTLLEGMRISLAVWAGFIFSTMLISAQFQGKSFMLLVIDSLYYLVNCTVFGIILVLWR